MYHVVSYLKILHKFTKKTYLQHPQVFSGHNTPKTTTALFISYFINFKDFYTSIYPYALLYFMFYLGADKSLAQPTSRCILFDGENISFYASLVICINSTNIPPIMIINRIYETQNLLSL